MQFSDVYVFIISSLDHPIYRKIQNKRNNLLRLYNIPYTVMVNSHEVDVNNMEAEPTLTPLLEDEILYNGAGYNPYMSQKFLMGVKMLFRSYKNFNDVPNYIVRLNASVYVHFPSLLHTIRHPDFPRERVLAGPNWDDMFVQGMIMVFSKDVLLNILKDQRMYSKSIMKDNDDVALSVLADPYSKWVDWNQYLCMPNDGDTTTKGVYQLDKIRPRENKKWIFRIRGNDEDGRKSDVHNWNLLIKYFNESNGSTHIPITADKITNESKLQMFIWISVLIVMVIIGSVYCFSYQKSVYSKHYNHYNHRSRKIKNLYKFS